MGFIEEIVNVENIKQTMEELSTVQNLHINQIDFSILDTKYKLFYTDGRTEILESHEFNIRVDEYLGSPKIKQLIELYNIEFFETEEGFIKDQHFTLLVSKQKVKCAIKVVSDPKFIVDIKEYLIKLLAYNKILTIYGTGDIVTQFKEKGLSVGEKILISKSIIPIPPKDEHIEYNFDVTKNEEEFTEIEKGDEIIRIYHGVEGKSGRNLYGELIAVRPPNDLPEPIDYDDESVVLLKNKKYDTFYSKLKGFIKFKNNRLEVNNRMLMKGANQNKADHLGTNIENNIELEIVAENDSHDSVGAGITVVTTSIDTKGSVGKNVVLDAEKTNIKGDTHITTKIKSKDANITTLRGELESINATINEIINAKVDTEQLTANTIAGSTVEFAQGDIKEIKSNNKFIVKGSLLIETITGHSNTFIMKADDGSSLNTKYDKAREELNFMKKREIIIRDKLKSLLPQAQKIQQKLKDKVELSTLEKRTMLNVKETKRQFSEIGEKIKQQEIDVADMKEKLGEKANIEHKDVTITNLSLVWPNDNKFILEKGDKTYTLITDGKKIGKKIVYDEVLDKLVISEA